MDDIIAYKESTSKFHRDRIFLRILTQYERLLYEELIKKHNVSNVDIKDSEEYGVATHALIDALNRFDPDSGNQFSTFLTHHLNLFLKRHFASYSCGVTRYAAPLDDNEDDTLEYQPEEETRIPLFQKLDAEEHSDNILCFSYGEPVTLALRAIAHKIPRAVVFKLIGQQHKAAVLAVLKVDTTQTEEEPYKIVKQRQRTKDQEALKNTVWMHEL